MENPKAQKLLNKIQRDLMRNGFVSESIVTDLKDLRTYAVAENIPFLAKVIRLTYEHIEEYNTFNIAIPEDEPVDELGEINQDNREADPQESLDYLLSLMGEPNNKINALEIREYTAALTAYAEEH